MSNTSTTPPDPHHPDPLIQRLLDWLKTQITALAARLTTAETDITAAEADIVALEGQLDGLKIVRGIVTLVVGGATVTEGTDFTVARDGVGIVTITFTTPFSDRPAVIVTPIGGARAATETVGSPASGSAYQVSIFTTNTAANVDASFHFTAVGPV